MIYNISVDAADLFYGILVSDCLLPCLRTTATVRKKMTSMSFTGNTTVVAFNFDNKVRVRKTSIDQFSFMDSLNFFGSNLGLWPGLGLHQIIEWLVGMVVATQIIGRCRRFCRK